MPRNYTSSAYSTKRGRKPCPSPSSWCAVVENMTLIRPSSHHFIFALESSYTVALNKAAQAKGPF